MPDVAPIMIARFILTDCLDMYGQMYEIILRFASKLNFSLHFGLLVRGSRETLMRKSGNSCAEGGKPDEFHKAAEGRFCTYSLSGLKKWRVLYAESDLCHIFAA